MMSAFFHLLQGYSLPTFRDTFSDFLRFPYSLGCTMGVVFWKAEIPDGCVSSNLNEGV